MNKPKQQYDVLFIDDEKEIRENYVRYLKRDFVNVYQAVDGEQAYEVYKDKKPDIMIVDINLPKMNGLDLVRKIRETDEIVKIIMLTAYSDVKYLMNAIELKLIKYLVKPVSRDELKETLALAIEEYSKFDVVSKEIINIGEGFIWDNKQKQVLNNGLEVPFTNKEMQFVSLLLSNPKIVISYDEIILELWDSYDANRQESLKTIAKNVRKKLPKEIVKNVFGVGYKFL